MTGFMQEEPRQLMLDSSGVGQEVTDSEISQLDDGDRISNLPQDLLHCILSRLSVDDAAKTSVLSKEWRHIWATNTQLILDEFFLDRVTSNSTDKKAELSAFYRAVEMIRSAYLGNLLSFNLYIPAKFHRCPVTRWIEHFVKNGIRYLELDNRENDAYEIPTCLFGCVTLRSLKLRTWILNPPKCTIFTNLLEVELKYVTFNADISFGTQLSRLRLEECTGVKHLGSQFTKGNSLTIVVLAVREQLDWRWFEFTSLLKCLALKFTSKSNFNREKPINIIKFLNKLPSICAFHMSGVTLGDCRPGLTMTNGCATKCENLKELLLSGIGSYNLCHISNAIYLIRCLPNLQRLEISLSKYFRAPTINLDATNWNDMSLRKLHTVIIFDVDGSKYVSYMVKILLASSPSLKVMSLRIDTGLIPAGRIREELRIKQEFEHFPRKSLGAQILWFKSLSSPTGESILYRIT